MVPLARIVNILMVKIIMIKKMLPLPIASLFIHNFIYAFCLLQPNSINGKWNLRKDSEAV